MDLDQLGEIIRRHGAKSRDQMQVAERLRELLPDALLASKRALAPEYRGAAAERRALSDQSYLEKIEEFIILWGEAWEARIQFETHRMLMQAKQSIQAYHRVRERQGAGKASRS